VELVSVAGGYRERFNSVQTFFHSLRYVVVVIALIANVKVSV